MQDIQPELIEKYQILLQKDPKSRVFAPLAEAYRKMGLVEEAFRTAVRGVQFNPNFSGGRIALAKVFMERHNLDGAITELEKAVDLSPDNILAHTLLGDCYLHAKRPKDALRSFKMVLFLAPTNERAIKAVQKLESLTADEYDDDVFEMKPLRQMDAVQTEALPLKPMRRESPAGSELERVLSLADAFIVRNDLEKAADVLKEGELRMGQHPELIKRMKLVNQRGIEDADAMAEEGLELSAPEPPVRSRKQSAIDDKISLLQQLLKRVHEYSQFTGAASSIIKKSPRS